MRGPASTPAPHYLSTLLVWRLARQKLNFRVEMLEAARVELEELQYPGIGARTGKRASAAESLEATSNLIHHTEYDLQPINRTMQTRSRGRPRPGLCRRGLAWAG